MMDTFVIATLLARVGNFLLKLVCAIVYLILGAEYVPTLVLAHDSNPYMPLGIVILYIFGFLRILF